MCYLNPYIYIYAFSRRFYPKRLTVHSGYTYFCQYMCSLGIEPTNICAMLYHWATGTRGIQFSSACLNHTMHYFLKCNFQVCTGAIFIMNASCWTGPFWPSRSALIIQILKPVCLMHSPLALNWVLESSYPACRLSCIQMHNFLCQRHLQRQCESRSRTRTELYEF